LFLQGARGFERFGTRNPRKANLVISAFLAFVDVFQLQTFPVSAAPCGGVRDEFVSWQHSLSARVSIDQKAFVSEIEAVSYDTLELDKLHALDAPPTACPLRYIRQLDCGALPRK
jgi:hypothetical protein